jgi:hypothetical protein
VLHWKVPRSTLFSSCRRRPFVQPIKWPWIGIVDASNLADCLSFGLGEDLSTLDKSGQVRRALRQDIITPVSTANLKQLNGQDPDNALENGEMLKRLAGRERHLWGRADEQRYH